MVYQNCRNKWNGMKRLRSTPALKCLQFYAPIGTVPGVSIAIIFSIINISISDKCACICLHQYLYIFRIKTESLICEAVGNGGWVLQCNSSISRSDFNYRCIFMCMFFVQLSLGILMENVKMNWIWQKFANCFSCLRLFCVSVYELVLKRDARFYNWRAYSWYKKEKIWIAASQWKVLWCCSHHINRPVGWSVDIFQCSSYQNQNG